MGVSNRLGEDISVLTNHAGGGLSQLDEERHKQVPNGRAGRANWIRNGPCKMTKDHRSVYGQGKRDANGP